jgi:hypothetical protein
MNVRSPCSVGTRPADVCGWCTSPSAASSPSVVRIDADESFCTSRCEMCFEPIGAASPTYARIAARSTSCWRSVRFGASGSPGGPAAFLGICAS